MLKSYAAVQKELSERTGAPVQIKRQESLNVVQFVAGNKPVLNVRLDLDGVPARAVHDALLKLKSSSGHHFPTAHL